MGEIFLDKCRDSLSTLLETRAAEENSQKKATEKNKSALNAIQVRWPLIDFI